MRVFIPGLDSVAHDPLDPAKRYQFDENRNCLGVLFVVADMKMDTADYPTLTLIVWTNERVELAAKHSRKL